MSYSFDVNDFLIGGFLMDNLKLFLPAIELLFSLLWGLALGYFLGLNRGIKIGKDMSGVELWNKKFGRDTNGT